ncbi:hypothetical protein [Oenococcus kitaharae]|uniref:Uncharacterized protein n=1 Tax=Oenococcus kitaharae DSM 17330 TaxID=1045004 RepID=G9WFZ3_9LACO|nr:hypothetical protein [Oenococcus kitaharae]EHN59571.1 hypothetical protein OKIT_1490 [Oenococcus kitaharae DSM 17330]OEY83421.1 hypothetical protein NT95_04655 [Oenococcus kitaharae]OEY85220.1 hypothetical protein NT96_01100 [Oenococcus kitaharae]OEY86074.1 hypothetical protein NV75_01050 [Oenococcus kitaharae]
MANQDRSLAQLAIFQQHLDLDSRRVAALSRALKQFLSAKNPVDNILAIRELMFVQLQSGPLTEFAPLFRFDDGFWLSQLFIRLLSFKNNDFFSTLDSQNKLSLGLRSRVLPNFEFIFVPAAIAAGGFYLQEANLQIRILYFDIRHQRFFIEPNGLLALFTSDIGKHLSSRQLELTVKALNDLAEVLQEDQFVLDLNIIQAENDAQLEINKADLPVAVSDRLFILAQANQVDIVALDDGFLLNLNSSLKLYFTQVVDRIGHAQWRFRVSDKNDSETFLSVLLKYAWLLNWYWDNIQDLQIAYRDEFFLG